MKALAESFASGATDRWLSQLAQMAPGLHPRAHRSAMEALIRRAVERGEGGSKKPEANGTGSQGQQAEDGKGKTEKLTKQVLALWRETWNFLNDPDRRGPAGHGGVLGPGVRGVSQARGNRLVLGTRRRVIMQRLSLILTPADVTVFRDSRPFEPGATGSRSEFPPPRAVAGAIRTWLLNGLGTDSPSSDRGAVIGPKPSDAR